MSSSATFPPAEETLPPDPSPAPAPARTRSLEARLQESNKTVVNKSEVQVLGEQARRLVRKGRFAGALQLYRKVAALEPDNPAHHVRVARAAIQAGDLGLAEPAYRRAAQLFSESGEVLRAWATLRLALDACPDTDGIQEALAALIASGEWPSRAPAPDPSVDVLRFDAPSAASERHNRSTLSFELPPAAGLRATVPGMPALVLEPPTDPHTPIVHGPPASGPGAAAAAPGGGPELDNLPLAFQPHVKRLSPNAFAIKLHPAAPWMLFMSSEPIRTDYASTLALAMERVHT